MQLGISDLFSSHWSIVLLVGLLFFAIQLMLCVRFMRRIAKQSLILSELYEDYLSGGDGRRGIQVLQQRFAWLKWVNESFPSRAAAVPGNFTRDDVLQELETRVASDANYLLLQRMGVMAPLLGVILTVVGFWFLDVDGSEEMQLQDILLAVTPLVSGVGAGAVLALLNQGMLQWAGARVEAYRMLARTWFDAAIWSTVGLDAQSASMKAITAMQNMATAVTQTAERHEATATQLEQAVHAIASASENFHNSLTRFDGQMSGIPESLHQLRNALQQSGSALDELIPVGSRAVASLDVSVAAFRTTIDQQFKAASQEHFAAISGLAESFAQMSATNREINEQAVALRRTLSSNTDSFRELAECVHELVPSQKQLHQIADGFATRMEELSVAAETLGTNVAAVSGDFQAVIAGLGPSIAHFCAAVDSRFGPAADLVHGQVMSIGDAVGQLQGTASTLRESAAALGEVLDKSVDMASTMDPTRTRLVEAVDLLARSGAELQQAVQQHLEPSQRALHGAANELGQLVRDGFAPASRTLAEFNQTLSQLQDTVASIREFSRARDDIERLNHSLAKAAEVADAIGQLPAQIRDVLEHSVSPQPDPTEARGGIARWLRGRRADGKTAG